jgi:hypothetical protein
MSAGEPLTAHPSIYENEYGVACLAPYVPVYDTVGDSFKEVGAVVKGQRFTMAEVMGLDPDALAAEGVIVPSHIVSSIHAGAAERAATASNVISLEVAHAA